MSVTINGKLQAPVDSTITSLVGAILPLPVSPTIFNITLTTPNFEYSQALPAGCQRFSVSIQGGDGLASYRMAFVTGKVATPTVPYLTLKDNVEYSEVDVYTSATVYLAHTVGSKTAQIVAWV